MRQSTSHDVRPRPDADGPLDAGVRDLGRLDDAQRAARAAATGGCPVLTFDGARTPYIDYQSVDVLHSLQQPRSGAPAELTFYVLGQVKELLFKLMYEDLRRVRDDLDADAVGAAVWSLRRLRKVADLLVNTWDVLGTLSPSEFNSFRDHLGDASGLQSYMYRMLEFVLGNKRPSLTTPHTGVPHVSEQVRRALEERSVYDAAVALLARRGAAIDPATLRHDPARPRPDCPTVEQAWRDVYRELGPADEVFQLAEALMDVAEAMSRWRALHLLVVERTIGNKPGTGGSSGAAWLRRVNEHRFFGELWAARSVL
ncbi:tryptophan 2,3-dioxygenase [Streptomyces sp. PTM05]|uniref:Tryptophan 2,3-dioxygenase n=1 Tax=Streptantibioticus parmotrematis TaxID=2873249 RepID=A0ABS7QQ96_9ACTN|nr:tryptophan 2,3-dioxygenase family protein [Streptantibioticus parmotrematis]MBY8885366.1 tryptophan 2,3-dioxygenase [Streptantibioticus parmotrematis]